MSGVFRGTGGTGEATTDVYASEISGYANTATDKAAEAASSAASAQAAQTAAEAAQTAAETAETNAETAETNAETAETNAEAAETAAESAQASAETAQTAAETAKTAAETAKTAAETAETNAETAESNASTHATTATTKASEAATSATSAATSATSASTSATSASTSATAAQTAQTAAEAAQTAAEAAQESIDGFFLGAQTSNPTVDLNGNAVTSGDWYFNTTDSTTRIYDGSSWNTVNPDLIGDTTPQLGGDLDLNSNDITGTGNLNITGDIAVSGTVDGRDVATDGTKLDGIEASADVTDATNVEAAGALMDDEVTNLAQVKAFDSSDYATAAQGTKADTAHGWGNHADAGYLTSFSEADTLDSVTGRGATTTNAISTGAITSSSTITATTTLNAQDGLFSGYVDANGLINGFMYRVDDTTVIDSSRNLTNIGTISSGGITSTGSSSGRYTGLEVVNTTSAADTETAIGFGVISAGNSACDVKLVANRVGANAGSDFYIEQSNSSGNAQETFRISELGNVGIGTSNPQQVLQISQGASAGTTALRIENTETGIDPDQVANAVEFYTNDASAGGTGVTGKIFQVSENSGTRYSLGFSTYNGTTLSEAMRIDDDGNVGIGNSSPTATLDVTGTAVIDSGSSLGLKIEHDSFGNALELHREDNTNSAAITFSNNAGQSGILYGRHSDKRPVWRPGGTTDNHQIFTDNYHPNADKWTTSRTLTLSGDVTGSVSWDGSDDATLTTTVSNDSHTHAFSNLSGKNAGTGDYSTNGDLVAGRGSGSVALTINDGKGNSNVTFNHQNGTPDQDGNAGRIEVNTDSSTGAKMDFEVKSGVTNGTSVDLTNVLRLEESRVTSFQNVRLQDNVELNLGTGDDVRFFHNNSHAYLYNQTGSLVIETTAADTDVVIKSDDGSGGSADYIRADGSSGEVRLGHYGSTKIRTLSSGAVVQGNLAVHERLYHSGDTDTYMRYDTNRIRMYFGGQLCFDTSFAELDTYSTGNVPITAGRLVLKSGGKTGWGVGDEMGAISFYNSDTTGIGARTAASIVCENNQGNGSTTTTFHGELAFYTSQHNANLNSDPALLLQNNNKAVFYGDTLVSDGTTDLAKTAAEALVVNRKGTNRGDIVNLKSNGSQIGRFGYKVPYGGVLYWATSDASDWGIGLYTFSTSKFIQPIDSDADANDNAIDIGSSTARFDDVYATNGTIQTSDRNEKQDIQALTDAEQRVATACKGLIRRFRWIDSVEEKGEDARYHFGAIAQDVEAAFAAEGLDAGDYALFIKTTWWEHEKVQYPSADVAPEGAVEKTRMGIRYNQLLAFIISAL